MTLLYVQLLINMFLCLNVYFFPVPVFSSLCLDPLSSLFLFHYFPSSPIFSFPLSLTLSVSSSLFLSLSLSSSLFLSLHFHFLFLHFCACLRSLMPHSGATLLKLFLPAWCLVSGKLRNRRTPLLVGQLIYHPLGKYSE